VEPSKSKREGRPIHHSPVFWVGMVLCLVAIAIYLWSDDLSFRHSRRYCDVVPKTEFGALLSPA
jgi:hypothetical protein